MGSGHQAADGTRRQCAIANFIVRRPYGRTGGYSGTGIKGFGMTSLVLWHGWGMSPSVWDTLIAELRAVMPDDVRYDAIPLPGYDATALPDGTPLACWADAMAASIGEPPPIARKASQPFSRYIFCISFTTVTVGFAAT